MKVLIENRHPRLALDRPALRRLLRHLTRSAPDLDQLRRHPDARRGLLSITFLDGAQMRAAHEAAFGTARSTDVICFDYRQPDAVWTPDTPWAEVLIDVDTARAQADEHHVPLPVELLRYLTHALLHLAGYDDHAPAAAARMRDCQEATLARLLATCEVPPALERTFRVLPTRNRARSRGTES